MERTKVSPRFSERTDTPIGRENAVMLTSPHPARTIELVPALLVCLLNESGKLPPIPNEPTPGVVGFRKPQLEDMQTLQYVACWEGGRLDKDGFRRVAGLASFRDVYDWHSSCEVRELIALRGSKRACVALTKWLVGSGMMYGRRLVGSVQVGDIELAAFMKRLGGKTTRWHMEYGGVPSAS